jgi:polo-like kinase 1
MNAYTFPDHVVVSDAAKDLIQRILIGDPTSRPTHDEIIKHDFLTKNAIPKSLPPSFLACPPSAQYLKQYLSSQPTSHSAHPYQTS